MDARLFKEIVENQVLSKDKIEKLEKAVTYLQNKVNSLELVPKSRNVSNLDEKSSEMRSRNLGRMSHEAMLEELKKNGAKL